MGTLATSLAAADWALDAHRAIAKVGKASAADHGGVMHPWSKRSASKRSVKLAAWDRTNADAMQLRPRQPGLWAIREDGAKGHGIPKRYTKRGRARRGGKALTIPGSKSGYAAHASHPGASAKRSWSKVKVDVERQAPALVDKAVRRTLADVFGAGG